MRQIRTSHYEAYMNKQMKLPFYSGCWWRRGFRNRCDDGQLPSWGIFLMVIPRQIFSRIQRHLSCCPRRMPGDSHTSSNDSWKRKNRHLLATSGSDFEGILSWQLVIVRDGGAFPNLMIEEGRGKIQVTLMKAQETGGWDVDAGFVHELSFLGRFWKWEWR